MSLRDLVLSLISEVPEADNRMGISATIYLLRDAYMHGRATEDDLRDALRDVVDAVISMTEPLLEPEEKKKKVEKWVNQLLGAIKMETVRVRTLRRVRF